MNQNYHQLRAEVDAYRNYMQSSQIRSTVVGNDSNRAAMHSDASQVNDILKSMPDFDSKSNDSIKRFVSVTDLLWSSIGNNPLHIERFRLKLNIKLAVCNQSFINKIREMQWPQIKAEILKDFSVNSARDTQAQLNTIKQKSDESLFEYANRCKNLLFDMNSFLGANADPGLNTIHDRSAREAFLKGLSDGKLRDYVKNVPSRNLQELIDTTVERFERNLQIAPQNKCTYCQKDGHREPECRKKQSDAKNRDSRSNTNNNSGRNSNQNSSNGGNRSNQNNNNNSGRSSHNSNNNNRQSNQYNNQPNRNNNSNQNASQNWNQNRDNNNSRGNNSNNFNRNQSNANNSGNQSFPTRVFDNSQVPSTCSQMALAQGVTAPNPYSHGGLPQGFPHFNTEN